MSGTPRNSASQSNPSSPNNLPLLLTSFVGREKEIIKIRQLLSGTRLVTLTGPGGVGKTRLGLQVAAAVLNEFEDGAWVVELASLTNPQLMTQEVIMSLGLREEKARSKLATLSEFLQNKNLLLVLDNCEHLVTACAEMAEHLLQVCPQLHILATSREALGIGGETVWHVSPLSLPDLDRPPTLESLTDSEAAQLFIARAEDVQPAFRVTATTAEAIALVCHQLDGIPLAIELAATRVKVLSVPQIAARLDDRFRLLTGGSRTALQRHQTLQAAMDWSYDLLSGAEQQLFRRLAVFAGGFTMEAVEVVLGDRSGQGPNSANTVLDLLTNLVDKSLVVVHHGQETRYRMLETIREYAREKLLASGEVGRIRARHLAYYLQFAEEAEVRLRGADQVNWFGRLELEQDNCRAALDWSLESEAIEEGSRLAGALGLFWNQRGYLSEGSEWLERFLAEARLDDLIRAKALLRAAHLAWQQNNHEQALAQVEQSLALCRRHGDKRGIARSLHLSGVLAHWMGDRDQGGNLLEESLSLSREISDDLSVIDTLLFLGDIRLRQGDNELAAVMIQESLALSRKLSDQWGIAFAISSLGEIARRDGDYEQAVSYFQKALDIAQEQSFRVEMPFQLEALAMTVAEQGHSKLAAHLWGAAEALREAIHSPLPPSYHAEYAPYKDAIRGALGEEALTSAWDEGQALSTDQVIALAMSAPAAETPPPTASADRPPFGLTPREVEVLGLVSTGLTDAQVAEELFISPRTVSKHLQSIYSKLDLSSRSAATRFAIEHNLL